MTLAALRSSSTLFTFSSGSADTTGTTAPCIFECVSVNTRPRKWRLERTSESSSREAFKSLFDPYKELKTTAG